MIRQFVLVLNVLGFVIGLFAFTMLVPLAVSWGLDDGAQQAYGGSFLITMFSGAARPRRGLSW